MDEQAPSRTAFAAAAHRAAHQVLERGRIFAALNEPWLSYFAPADLAERLQSLGFVDVEDHGPPQLAARHWPGAAGAAPQRGGHVLFAATSSAGGSPLLS